MTQVQIYDSLKLEDKSRIVGLKVAAHNSDPNLAAGGSEVIMLSRRRYVAISAHLAAIH